MAFPLPLVRFTARRSGDAELPILYPRLLRDRSMLPKVGIAIEYFQSLAGHERREMDPEVLVQFFGDHKLARCIVACLSRSYLFRAPALETVVTKQALRRLEKLGLDTPVALRLYLFDDVNEAERPGFLEGTERPEAMTRLERNLRLRSGELDRLLRLDAPEHAVLVRRGPVPKPEDVVAQYNLGVAETLLRHAERVELTFLGAERETAAQIQRLCHGHQVTAALRATGRALTVTLAGRQDAMGLWARHGWHVARAAIELLDRGRDQVLDGTAVVAIRDRRALLRLNAEVLDILAGAPAPSSGWEEDVQWDEALWPQAAHLLRGERRGVSRGRTGTPSRRTRRAAWGVRRLPEPQAWATGTVVPALTVEQGERQALVCPVRSRRHAARLAAVAQHADAAEGLLFLGPPAALEPLAAIGAQTRAVEAAEPAAVAAALREAFFSKE